MIAIKVCTIKMIGLDVLSLHAWPEEGVFEKSDTLVAKGFLDAESM